MTKIKAEIVADSINKQGNRITTFVLTFPRILLSELNTHRMFTKNSASSRAIPFKKMVESVKNDPFIPIAWQKDHSGMQGSEYLNDASHENDHGDTVEDATSQWLEARDSMIHHASLLHNVNKVTKQLCNRLLEPFMWHTVILTATEYYNFFELRSPHYEYDSLDGILYLKSKEDWLKKWEDLGDVPYSPTTEFEWLGINKGMAEIHMMALAEAMWNARNKSTPQLLNPGEWHIPFRDKIDHVELSKLYKATGYNPDNPTPDEYYFKELDNLLVKISTAMCARTSFTTVGDEKEFTPDDQLALHDRLINQRPLHASPMEHCARAMDHVEYHTYIKGRIDTIDNEGDYITIKQENPSKAILGWCRNYKGFIQYREIIENNQTI